MPSSGSVSTKLERIAQLAKAAPDMSFTSLAHHLDIEMLSVLVIRCRDNRFKSIPEQHFILSAKLRGHYGYYGITGNAASLSRFLRATEELWMKWRSRRSWKTPKSWTKLKKILRRFPLPKAIPVHSVLRYAANI